AHVVLVQRPVVAQDLSESLAVRVALRAAFGAEVVGHPVRVDGACRAHEGAGRVGPRSGRVAGGGPGIDYELRFDLRTRERQAQAVTELAQALARPRERVVDGEPDSGEIRGDRLQDPRVEARGVAHRRLTISVAADHQSANAPG